MNNPKILWNCKVLTGFSYAAVSIVNEKWELSDYKFVTSWIFSESHIFIYYELDSFVFTSSEFVLEKHLWLSYLDVQFMDCNRLVNNNRQKKNKFLYKFVLIYQIIVEVLFSL